MRLRIIAVGRLKAGPDRSLAERYMERCRPLLRQHGWSGPDAVELSEGRGRSAEERREDEAVRVRAEIADGPVIAFDEGGEQPTSVAFAAKLGGFRESGRRHLAILIGGPDGLAAGLRREADWTVSFGRMTLPHQLVRVLVWEQIYRAFTIISGHPYHRAGDGEP